MERLALLREHARDLRKLARSFDTPQDREQLLAIAEWCERLADSIERSPSKDMRKPRQTHPLFNW
jgi:hypothetical protein